MSPRQTGLVLLLVALASILGTQVVGWVQRRVDPLLLSTVVALRGAAVLVALACQGQPALALLVAPLTAMGFAAGLTGPTAISHVLHAEAGLEGTATSLAGALQMGLSALMAWLLGKFTAQSALQLGLAMLPLSALSAAAAAFLHRRTKDCSIT